MPRPSLLVLVPAYNEERRIGPTLDALVACFSRDYEGAWHILVVLNGCRDRTLDVVQDRAARHPEIRWVVFAEAIGKGGALIEGFQHASEAELIGFLDADGSTKPESFLQLARLCDQADFAIGSRRIQGAVIKLSQPSHRMLASSVFHAIVETLFRMRIEDTQCGAKILRREAALRIKDSLHIADMAFDVNLLYCAKRAGLRMIEAPVEWTDSAGSTVRYFRTSLVMFLSVIRLRLVYSPFYPLLRHLRVVEGWIYRKLRNPPPRPSIHE
jgi:dolichyl-phosphate beta-glucosyltransferase